jgi:hypothetical protein
MNKVKIFTNTNANEMEAKMNAWFEKNPNIKITNKLQNMFDIGSSGVLIITIFYEERKT